MTIEERIRVEPDGDVTALSGKVEFGQGIRTAFAQLVADELELPMDRVRVVLGDTGLVPFDAGTVGSHSIHQDGSLLRRAAAAARLELVRRASVRLGVPPDRLETAAGAVRVIGGGAGIGYGALVADGPLTGPIPDDLPVRRPEGARLLGTTQSRVEARDIVTGRARYVADVRLPGMLRGQVLHPPSRGASLVSLDDAVARTLPGVVAIVRDGDFAGVVAERDEQARAAVDALEAEWRSAPIEERPALDFPMRRDGDVAAALASAATTVEASYSLPYISNAPIGPSAAVADVGPDGAVLYVGTHRPFGLRAQAAALLSLPEERVRVIPQLSSGTYGRNSIGDAALEAVRLSRGAGRPVLVQWTREEEFALSPVRPAAYMEIAAGLSADGTITAWRYDEHTNVHTYSGVLNPQVAPHTSGRNAVPPYRVPALAVTLHVEPTPVRTASFRSLAAAENVFAIESFMDELAEHAGIDPLDFRLRHLDDPRLRAVLERVADACDWPGRPRGDGRGLGLACTLYHGTYVAHAALVSVAARGRVHLERMWCAIDPGLVVNPDGVRNQTEGGIQQSASWTLLEELGHRDGRITTTGWDTYPIATFADAPTSIEVILAGDPSNEPTGVGEPGSVPTAGAIANAVYAACGARVRDLPLSPDHVRRAMARPAAGP